MVSARSGRAAKAIAAGCNQGEYANSGMIVATIDDCFDAPVACDLRPVRAFQGSHVHTGRHVARGIFGSRSSGEARSQVRNASMSCGLCSKSGRQIAYAAKQKNM